MSTPLEIFPWNENFDTGIALIDEQHRKLVDLLNLLVRHIAHQSSAVQLDAIFDEIKDYVAFHFTSEEGIWKDYFEGDTWERWHKQSHIDFVAEVGLIEARVSDKPKDETLLEIVKTLTHWLARHILDSDKRMAKVVLALPSGISLARAKEAANEEMTGSTKLLIDTVMTMYDKLANSTVQMSREIQKRKAVEEELRLSQQAVEAASRAKTAFLAHMSHELRTPLSIILGYTDLLHGDPTLSGQQREMLNIVRRSSEHLREVIHDVLELTKIEAGHVQLSLQPFNLADTARDIIEMFALRAQEKQLALRLVIAQDFPTCVVSDEFKIRQILINLISNAIKATPQGHVTLHLKANPQASSPTMLLTVEDSGIGIAPQDQERIFLPFEQAIGAPRHEGTGLGLPICRQFVTHLQGRIELRSVPGQGSAFAVELPLAVGDPHDILGKGVDRGAAVRLAAGTPTPTVLVADDDPDSLALLAEILGRVGCKVLRASDGTKALAVFQSERPELVLLDRNMPGMSGEEVARHLRSQGTRASPKIAAVTASLLPLAQEDGLLHLFDDVVNKPFRAERIHECLERLLGVRFERQPRHAPEATEWQNAQPMTGAVPLPQPLLGALAQALVLLDQERIRTLLGEVATHDQGLAHRWRTLADNYQFDRILQQLPTHAPAADAAPTGFQDPP